MGLWVSAQRRALKASSHETRVLSITIMLRNFLLLKKQVTTVFTGKALNLILSKY